MTTNDEKRVEEIEEVKESNEETLEQQEVNQVPEKDISAQLLEEVELAKAKEAKEAERDRINTRLCYERALQMFYEEEGLDAEFEKSAKEKEEERQRMLDEMSYGQELKYKFNEFKNDMHNPLRRNIRFARFLGIVISIFRALILFGLCFVIFMPIFEKLSYAFRSPYDLNNPQVIWIPDQWSTMNIEISYELLTKRGHTYLNTFFLAAMCTFLQVIATAFPGYAFARLKFKGSGIIFYIVLASLAIPNEVLSVSRSLFFQNYGFFGYTLVGSSLAMYIMTIFGQGLRSAIFIYLFRQAFRNLPIELEESAEIDGAGVIRTFWSVMLPNARGAIVTVGLFAFVWQWNDSYFGNLLKYTSEANSLLAVKLANGTEGLRTVIETMRMANDSTLISFVATGVVVDPTFIALIANTAALMIMAPLLIGYFFVQRLFVESIERTGIVG